MKQVKNNLNPLMALACRTHPYILSLRACAYRAKKSSRTASRKHSQGLIRQRGGRGYR